MAAPTIVSGHTTLAQADNVTSHVINTPTHANGDVIYIAAAADSPATALSAPAGFAAVSTYDSVTFNSDAIYSVWKKTASSEGGSYTYTTSVAERSAAIAWAVNGDAGIHATGTPAGGTSATATVPAVTTSVTNTLRISIVFTDTNTTPHGTPTGHTQLAAVGVTSGASVSVAYKTLASSGTDASQTASLNVTDNWVGLTFAIDGTSGSIAVTPAAASVVSSAVGPTIVLGSLSVSPDAASVASSAVGPATINDVILTPAAAISVSSATLGAVDLSAIASVTFTLAVRAALTVIARNRAWTVGNRASLTVRE